MLEKLVKLKAKKNRGFTLIELIVVIAILGVLAAILVPSMMGFVENAREAAGDANARTAYVAAQAYITQQVSKGITVAEADITVANLSNFLGSTYTGTIAATLSGNNVTAVVWTSTDANAPLGYYPASTRP